MVSSRASYASAGAFGAVVLLSAGSRRRYGTYNDGDSDGVCSLLTEEEMSSACLNLMTDATQCHDCIACETEDCMYAIANCDEYLATVYTECCVEGCNGEGIITIIVLCVFGCAGSFCVALFVFKVLKHRALARSRESQHQPSSQPYGQPQAGAVVQGRVMAVGAQKNTNTL